MTTLRRIAINTVFLLISQAVNLLLTFFYMTCMARYLGPAGYGILTFALAFTSIFGVFTDFNLQLLIAREVARDEKAVSKYLANITVIKIILCIITYILLAAVINLMGYPWQTVQVVYLLGLSVLFTAFSQMFYAIFQSFQRLEFQAIGQMLNAVLMTLLVIVAINFKLDVVVFGYMYVASAAAVLLYCFLAWKLKVSRIIELPHYPVFGVNWGFWKETFRHALPFGLSAVFVMVFYWISTVMLSLMKGDEAVGLYNAPYRLVLVLSFIPAAFVGALYPAMSKLINTAPEAFRRYYETTIKYLLIMAVPLGIGTTILAKEIILLIFGSQYEGSVTALQVLIWSEVFIFASQPMGNLFNSLNKQKIVTWITGVCLIVNVGLNLVLIPVWGVVGAAITTALTEGLSLLVSYIYVIRLGYGPAKSDIFAMVKMILAGAVMAVFLLLLHQLNLFILIAAAAVVYLVTLILIRGIDRQEFEMLSKIVRSEGK